MHLNSLYRSSIVLFFTAFLLAGCFGGSNSPPNNPPVAGADVTNSVDEGAAAINGQLTSSDPDDGATATFSITGAAVSPAGFVLNSDGSYSFDPADNAYDHLNVGGSDVLIIPITVTDDRGATDTMQIQITVNGTNDAPIGGATVTENVDVGDATVIGQLVSSDADDDSTATFAITGGASAPAGFVLNADGSFSFDPTDPAYAALTAGDSQLVSVAVTVTDDQSATGSTQVDITISGVNNRPVAVNDFYDTFGNTLLEVGVAASGNIAVKLSGSVLDNDSDLDATDVLTVSLASSPVSGSVSINAQGQFSYVPPTGLTATTDSFSYSVSDGSSSATATVSINLTELIWYVDNLNAGGTGTSSSPFSTLAQAEASAADGDTVYIAFGDGTSNGLDDGLTLAVPNVSVFGAGEALVIASVNLAAAGNPPTITSTAGSGITLNVADNTLIMGLDIDGVAGDGLSINDSTGVMLEAVSIRNSGESAIQGAGADVELTLTDVIIENVDVIDPGVSDDAIFIQATTSSSLVMSGGSISGVPGNLGDAIEFENVDSTNPVTMNVDIRGVTFSAIQQDGIKLDNDHGVMDVQIGGSTVAEGNIFDVGFRGIQIQTDQDPSLNRTNRIFIQQNNITSGNEGIQIRNINDISNLSILDNTLTRSLTGSTSDLIDVQVESASLAQARINRNDISNVGGSDGIRVRVLDSATLDMEALNNIIDGPLEGFDFDVIETDGAAVNLTTLNTSVLNNTLSAIGSQAMNARNADATSVTCMDLQGNSTGADYVLDAITGSFLLTAASQLTVFDPAGGSFSDPGTCPVPAF